MQKRSLLEILKTLRKIISPFFRSPRRRTVWFYCVILLVLSMAVSAVQVWMSYANRDMMTALSASRAPEFSVAIGYYVLTILVAIPIGVFYRFFEERLGLLWRDWMTGHLIKRYFFRRAYYQMRGNDTVDNPDQRITEDVRNFSAITLSLALLLLNSTVTLVAFIGVLWSISTTLVLVLFAYAVTGTVVTALIGHRLISIHYNQYQKEADLRYGLVRVRDNSESIAFFRGEARERLDLVQRLSAVVGNTVSLIGWNRNLAFFTSGYNYIALVVPIAVVAPLYFSKEIEFGVIPQAAGAFAQVLASLSLIISQFERLSAYVAGAVRIGGLWDFLHGDEGIGEELDDDPEIEIQEGRSLVFKELTVIPPKSDRELVTDLNFSLPLSKGLLIMGASGTGKSSVLRTVAGLWKSGEGSLQRPQLSRMMFLPQKPYIISGSLRANALYPQRDSEDISDEVIAESLKTVALDSLVERVEGKLETELDWGNILSIGEQQRLSFARLLLAKPELAFLDEATSALDEENEERLYSLMQTLGCSFVSIGHRSTLKKFHSFLLLIKGGGRWSIEELPPLAGQAGCEH